MVQMIRTAGRNIASSQCCPALRTYEIQATKVIPFTQWLLLSIGTIDGKELGRNYGSTVL